MSEVFYQLYAELVASRQILRNSNYFQIVENETCHIARLPPLLVQSICFYIYMFHRILRQFLQPTLHRCKLQLN